MGTYGIGGKMIAIVPARGGSKGLPGKNIKDLCGKPMIAYTIEAAQKSKYISKIIVSTDDQGIADTAKLYGAEIPFMRPESLAQDSSKALDVYVYTIEQLENDNNTKITDFIVLQPTSPLRRTEDIDRACEIYFNNKADSVISVVEADIPLQWYKEIDKNGKLKKCFEDENNLNRQEYKPLFIPNGAIYIFNKKKLFESREYYMDNSYSYIMKREHSVDIDTLLDFQLAQLMIMNNS